MNEKFKVLNQIHLSKLSAEKVAESNLDRAMLNADFKKFYLEMRSLNFDISKLAFEHKDTSKQTSQLKLSTANAEKALAKLNLTFADFEPHYACKKCCDTGYQNGNLCECFFKKLNRELVHNIGMNVDNSHTFQNADYSIFDDGEKMKVVYDKIKNWCDKIEESKFKNLLLSGSTGVGKTYLVECACNELLNRDKFVSFYSAFSLNNLFLKYHTTFDESKSTLLDGVLGCDVLVIDDLGSEPKFKNVTEEYLYLVLNERLSKGKSTIVTTNLSLDEILDKYGERVFSRLCNKSNSLIVHMGNKDLRLKRK